MGRGDTEADQPGAERRIRMVPVRAPRRPIIHQQARRQAIAAKGGCQPGLYRCPRSLPQASRAMAKREWSSTTVNGWQRPRVSAKCPLKSICHSALGVACSKRCHGFCRAGGSPSPCWRWEHRSGRDPTAGAGSSGHPMPGAVRAPQAQRIPSPPAYAGARSVAAASAPPDPLHPARQTATATCGPSSDRSQNDGKANAGSNLHILQASPTPVAHPWQTPLSKAQLISFPRQPRPGIMCPPCLRTHVHNVPGPYTGRGESFVLFNPLDHESFVSFGLRRGGSASGRDPRLQSPSGRRY